MNTIETISSHRSIRRFKSDPVADDLLDDILEAGIRASSYGNMNPYSIVVSRERVTRERLFVPLKNQQMVLDAPVLLTFCADFRTMRKWLRLNEAPDNFGDFFSFLVATIDVSLVAQNVALAAESHGLGICYNGATLANTHLVGEVLELPTGVVAITSIVMGWPDEDPSLRDRLPLAGLIHRERYHDHSDEEIAEIYKNRNEAGWNRYMSRPRLREMVESSDVENLAQLYTTLKYTPDAHEEQSASLLTYLRRQGFLD